MADIIIPLTTRLDLSAVAGLQEQLVDACNADISLDLSRVTHLGALSAQLLIAAAWDAKSDGCKLSLLNTSDQVLEQMSVMGMTPETIAEGL